MYASVTAGRDLIEDTIDSPFVVLDLIRPLYGAKRHFVLNRAAKPSLAPDIVVYTAVDFAVERRMSSRLMTLSRLAHSPGSPGRAFQLTELELGAVLERCAHPNVRLVQAAGTRQLLLDEKLGLDPLALLDRHYARRQRKTAETKAAA
jgi:hypothetical protein